jgi:hypothetical protein
MKIVACSWCEKQKSSDPEPEKWGYIVGNVGVACGSCIEAFRKDRPDIQVVYDPVAQVDRAVAS